VFIIINELIITRCTQKKFKRERFQKNLLIYFSSLGRKCIELSIYLLKVASVMVFPGGGARGWSLNVGAN